MFFAVAETASVNRAAAVLGTSQQTLSRRLAELERHVGAPLFFRTCRPRQSRQRLGIAANFDSRRCGERSGDGANRPGPGPAAAGKSGFHPYPRDAERPRLRRIHRHAASV